MILAVAIFLIAGTLLLVLAIRDKDLPAPPAPSPFLDLDERKNAIYENLRDLQFEYRVGKLSDEDYQKAKGNLQGELAQVMSQIDQLKGELGVEVVQKAKAAVGHAPRLEYTCPHCNASFKDPLKFCGECGKPMGVRA
jgi:rRNA maturation endonuclease Nob1